MECDVFTSKFYIFTTPVFRMFCYLTVICTVYSLLKIVYLRKSEIWTFCAMIYYDFRLHRSTYFAMVPFLLWKDDITNLTMAAVRPPTKRSFQISGSGSINIFQILHDHLAVKNVFARWVPHNLTKSQKDAMVRWCKATRKKYKEVCILLYQVTNYELMRMNRILNISWLWMFQVERNPTKFVLARSTLKQRLPFFVFFKNLVMWQLCL